MTDISHLRAKLMDAQQKFEDMDDDAGVLLTECCAEMLTLLESPAAPQVAGSPRHDQCDCSCGTVCPLGRMMGQVRCTAEELREGALSLKAELEGWRKTGLRDAATIERLTTDYEAALSVGRRHLAERDSAREAERGAIDKLVTAERERDSARHLLSIMQEEMEAPTPAAPCGNVDRDMAFGAWLAKDTREVDDISHKDAFDAGYAAAKALAETKAVES